MIIKYKCGNCKKTLTKEYKNRGQITVVCPTCDSRTATLVSVEP